MVGGLEAGRRVAAAALLAFGSVVRTTARSSPHLRRSLRWPIRGRVPPDGRHGNHGSRARERRCPGHRRRLCGRRTACRTPSSWRPPRRGRSSRWARRAATAGSGIVGTSSGIVGTSSGSAAGAPNGRPRSPRRPPRARRPPQPPHDVGHHDVETTTTDTTTTDTATAIDVNETTSETSSDDGSSIGSSDDGSDSGSSDTDNQVDSGANGVHGRRGHRQPDDRQPDHQQPDPPQPDHRRHRDGGRHVRLGHRPGRRGLRRHTVELGCLQRSGPRRQRPPLPVGGDRVRRHPHDHRRRERDHRRHGLAPRQREVRPLGGPGQVAGRRPDLQRRHAAMARRRELAGRRRGRLHGDQRRDPAEDRLLPPLRGGGPPAARREGDRRDPVAQLGRRVDTRDDHRLRRRRRWFSTTRADALPPGPMHLTLQLDWFPGSGSGAVRQSEMQVDWVRYYPVDGSGSATAITTGDTDTATTASVAGTTSSRRHRDEHGDQQHDHRANELRLIATRPGTGRGHGDRSPWPLPVNGDVSGRPGGCGTRTAGRRCRSAG